mgnify:CR=1 FL=1|tara:strand:+ start:65 stop:301 length:237 start_codon:yes stop_codon:yes gene_type:complete
MNTQLIINFQIEQGTPPDVYTVLAAGLLVRRNSDGVLGTIEKFGHRFGKGLRAYNAYYVRWSDGKLGYPNESDFQPCS